VFDRAVRNGQLLCEKVKNQEDKEKVESTITSLSERLQAVKALLEQKFAQVTLDRVLTILGGLFASLVTVPALIVHLSRLESPWSLGIGSSSSTRT
jgi:hypothetical protein